MPSRKLSEGTRLAGAVPLEELCVRVGVHFILRLRLGAVPDKIFSISRFRKLSTR
jgi:hypothetical protein